MGRLFWKLVVVFWIALLVSGYGVATVVRLHDESVRAETRALVGGPRAEFAVNSAASVLKHGGPDALRELLSAQASERGPQLLAVDAEGRDLLGRAVPQEAMARARRLAANDAGASVTRLAQAQDGRTYLLFMPSDAHSPESGPPRSGPPPGMRPPPEKAPPAPIAPIIAGLLASLAASALLAWYLTRPIRILRRAFESTASGHLDTRVAPLMGSRRDEIADLGRDFDRMAQRLEVLIASQRRLLHDVSHELRSPLARLQVAIGLARQNPQKLESTLDRVERESVRLDALVGELLTLSRLEAGTADRISERIDLTDLIAAIAEDARFEAQACGRDVSFDAGPPVHVHAHAESLHRAFENVVRNAVKFTAPESTVEIRLAHSQGGITATVCDRGPGVAAHELDKIFEPFYRGANQRSTSGTGLGLAIAQRAIQAQGGRMTASNRAGGGLCVEISLPSGKP
jgi:two-component system, OmpR family, sensor kinase